MTYLFAKKYITLHVDKSYTHIQNSEKETFNLENHCFPYLAMFLLTL